MKLLLCDINEELVEAWREAFADLPDVEIVHGSFEDQDVDCIVSASNSLGIMGAGLDGALRNYFGQDFALSIRSMVLTKFNGSLPVGESVVVPTGNENIPYMAFTPTMPFPGTDVSKTLNAYFALSAALSAIASAVEDHGVQINRVACAGLGTAIGRLSPQEAARQMADAWAQQPRNVTQEA